MKVNGCTVEGGMFLKITERRRVLRTHLTARNLRSVSVGCQSTK